ncbi:MAG TPA: MsnO8 family LLM class oxidoreductase [Streptosporangiaceae bacterium]
MKVSLLDQGVSFPGIGPYRSVRETLRLARYAEELGYERFWVAEHHGPYNTCGTPEVLLGAIAQHTKRIRLGSGTSLLPYYNPLRLATAFRLLEYLAPQRVDLAVGRGYGARLEVAERLGYVKDDYHKQVEALRHELEYLRSGEYPSYDVAQVWLTGSSAESAAVAAGLGVPYCFAQFVMPEAQPEVTQAYRAGLPPTTSGCFGLGVHVICCESASSLQDLRQMVRYTMRDSVPSAGQRGGEFGWHILVGMPAEVNDWLRELVGLYQPDELFVTTACPDFKLKLRSVELVRAMAADL